MTDFANDIPKTVDDISENAQVDVTRFRIINKDARRCAQQVPARREVTVKTVSEYESRLKNRQATLTSQVGDVQ